MKNLGKINNNTKKDKKYEPEYYIKDTKSIKNYIDDETLKTLQIIGVAIVIFIIAAIVGSLAVEDDKIESPTEVEFEVPDYNTYKYVSTTRDGKYAYVNSFSYSFSEGSSNVYYYENNYGDWSKPKKMKFGKDVYPFAVKASEDGGKLYFSGVKYNELDDEEGFEINLYTADLYQDTVSNITEVKCDDDSGIKIAISQYRDEGIYYYAMGGEEPGYKLVMYKDGKASEVGVDLQTSDIAFGFYSARYDQMYVFGMDTLKDTICERIGIKNGVRGDSEVVVVSDLAYEGTNIMSANLSGDGKTIYYSLSDGKIFKMSLAAFVNGYEPIKEPKLAAYEGTIYDEYDTSNYAMEYRKKPNMESKHGIYYEIFVRSFADSDGDGVGDFNGITSKLDYLKNLGIDGIWLMPINESSSYHGYDISDYYALNSEYGTEEDFANLLNEAHKLDIKIIMDFVINHTGVDNKWFTNACKDDSNKYRNYYRWVTKEDTVDYNLNDKAPWGCDVWYRGGNAFYYSIFYGGMPDLNYNNPDVRQEIKNAAGKWLNLGVDGFRLDAAIHIYGVNEFKQMEDRDTANIQWWNEFALYCESINPEVYLVGEAWSDEAILAQYAQPFDTKFDFTFELNMINALLEEKSVTKDKKDLAQSLEEIIEEYSKYDTNFIDGIFGSNHDQNRIMSQVYTEKKSKLAANIYLTLPGNPFIYYGEELGMKGKGADEYKRTGFIWSDDNSDMDVSWIEDTNNQDTSSLKEQIDDNNSMYNHYKKLITLRKSNPALSMGTYTAISSGNEEILSYERTYNGEEVLILHNLSKSSRSIDKSIFTITDVSTVIYADDGCGISDTSYNIAGYSTLIIRR